MLGLTMCVAKESNGRSLRWFENLFWKMSKSCFVFDVNEEENK